MSLVPMEEPVTTLVSPPSANPTIYPFTYSTAGTALVVTPVTQNPLVCADTAAPLAAGYTLNPVYYSPTGIVGATPLPFVFGATAAAPTVSAMAAGAPTVSISNGAMQFNGDALGSLVCYGLNANGTRRLTPDIFVDGLETPYNSTVVLSVIHVPTSATDYYQYTIDVTLPPLPATTNCGAGGLDCNFVLKEGFDSSLLATSSANATSGIGGQWCMAPAGTNTCSNPAPGGGTLGTGGNINVNYSNFGAGGLPTLTAPVAPAAAKTYHFVAIRYLKTGVNALPANAPVVIAALFSPTDLEENKLDDNVAVGTNQLANAAPAVVQTDGAWTTFSGKLSTLAENTDSGALTFNITDADTVESATKLTAAVTLNLNGLQVPFTPNCTLTSIQGVTPVNRQCTLDINLANPNWWNASVGPAYQGQGNDFATDPGGIAASARVVVTDSLGKSSAPVTINLHANSTVNNAPAISAGVLLPGVVDPKNSTTYPTYTCSVSGAGGAGGCGVPDRGVLPIDLTGAYSVTPGPLAAFDELASQTTSVVPFSDPNDLFANVQCVNEQQASVFVANGGPIVAIGASPTSYGMDFVLPATAPTASVSTLCTLTITDQSASFPNGQTAKTATSTFRIVVNP